MDTFERNQEQIREALRCYTLYAPANDLDRVGDDFIKKLAADNAAAKSELRELFRRSPVWNEELDALVINGSRTHNMDRSAVIDYACNIIPSKIFTVRPDDPIEITGSAIVEAWFYACCENRPETCVYLLNGDEMAARDVLNMISPHIYHEGRKASRSFKMICDALSLSDNTPKSAFQHNYALLADELSAKQIPFKLFITCGPGYFLTMSNPKCDQRGSTLTSCHSLNCSDYTYNSGCSGYARDPVSFLAFTVADPSDHESLFNRKTTRQVFAYRPGGGVLLQSRLYNTGGGTNGAQADSQVYRDLVQREISDLESVPNLWKTSPSCDSDLVTTDQDFGGYEDWTYSDFNGKISVRQDAINPEPLVIGASGLCLTCGDELGSDGGLFCWDCNDYEYCECCDDAYRSDDLYTVYDRRGHERHVCESCRDNYYEICEQCGEWHHRDDMTYVESMDGYVCEDCLNNHFGFCEVCEEYYPYDEITYVESESRYVCDHCLAEHYVQCSECGAWFDKSDAINIDDHVLCIDCQSKLLCECEECGCLIWEDDSVVLDGRILCETCAERNNDTTTEGDAA